MARCALRAARAQGCAQSRAQGRAHLHVRAPYEARPLVPVHGVAEGAARQGKGQRTVWEQGDNAVELVPPEALQQHAVRRVRLRGRGGERG